uniref:Phosphatidylinositol N-acetylglucosaminyltransferase subunit H conserved domain-containing protein n=1 Tax=Strigamia maritima TaxID=126957 RepID=T1J959_STRMM
MLSEVINTTSNNLLLIQLKMTAVEIHSEVVDGLSKAKLQFYKRHFICKQGLYHCNEYTLDIPVDLAQIVKRWTMLLGSLVFMNGFVNDMTLLFICIYVTIILIAIMNMFTCVTKESLLIEMEMVGIQQTTVYWFGWKSTEILNREDIVDVVINEAISMGQVVLYLTVVMRDKSLKPLFIHSKPRLYCLLKMYKEIQEIFQRNEKHFLLLQKNYFLKN